MKNVGLGECLYEDLHFALIQLKSCNDSVINVSAAALH